MALAERIERQAAALERNGRSPLYVELMRGAAASAARGGAVAATFAGVDLPRGSVPALRLMAALHHLVLEGRAPELARYFPSAGGALPPAGAWAAAERAIEEHLDLVRRRALRTVQTNEPGRSVVLYGALLWLTARHPLPVRLRELGASAGLNLIPDRYAYVVNGATLGWPDSPVRFAEPWRGTPVADPVRTAGRLRIADRAGCDLAPVDVNTTEGSLTALSYIWPDETERMQRLRRAIDVFLADPAPVSQTAASSWLAGGAANPEPGALSVVWQSVVRQYLPAAERRAVAKGLRRAGASAHAVAPLALVTMEPGTDHLTGFEVSVTTWPGEESFRLARAGDHGVPATW